MITKTVQDAVNEQINKELYSSYLYLSMSAYFSDKNLPGLAQWLRVQAEEERGHAMKFYDFLLDRGGRVLLKEFHLRGIQRSAGARGHDHRFHQRTL
jgi:ferritin